MPQRIVTNVCSCPYCQNQMASVSQIDNHGVELGPFEIHCNQCRYCIDYDTNEPRILPTEGKLRIMCVLDAVIESDLPYTLGDKPEWYREDSPNICRGVPPSREVSLEAR